SVGSREGKFAISLKFLKEWSHFLSFDYFNDAHGKRDYLSIFNGSVSSSQVHYFC
ncbi:unnamed protein product, partial [Brassica oleracea var. botrytis]